MKAVFGKAMLKTPCSVKQYLGNQIFIEGVIILSSVSVVAMGTEAPPTCPSYFLIAKDSQSEERVKGNAARIVCIGQK